MNTAAAPSGSFRKGSELSSRRSARQLALQLLFQREFHHGTGKWVQEFWATRSVTPAVRDYASQVFDGVQTHGQDVDRLINRYAVGWTVDRMPIVDRNILRCAIYELLWMPHIPAKVTVNEALELAKRFADDQARRFINGVLDRLLREEPALASKLAELGSCLSS